jgi:glycosyltransferase involved in cell wall biosynthesis
MSAPAISVVVPAYNAERWIGETLDTVVGQTEPADEIVVVDDGSTDGTRQIVARYGDRVRLLAQDNAGCGAAFNAAIAAATSDYVALCPADDLWVADKLAWQRETLRAHPEVDVSFGAAEYFGALEMPFPRPSGEGVLDARTLLRDMFVKHVIPDPTVVVRRALHERLGGFVAAVGEDYELWMRAARAGAAFHFDPRVMVRLRQHDANLSSDAAAIHAMTLEVRRAAAEDLGAPALAARVIARNERQLARARLGKGDVRAARAGYRDSLRTRFDAGAAAAVALLSLPGARPVVHRLNAMRAERTA